MRASIVTIGDELLIGQIVDTNSAYLAKELDKLGFDVDTIYTISDKKESIKRILLDQLDKVDLVILTGGLGPTKDDVTKKVFCEFFDDTLVVNNDVLVHVTTLLENYYKRPISDINKQQAYVPSTATVLFNPVGTAPGMLIKKGSTTYVSLPGVPFEMKTIFKGDLSTYLVSNFQNQVKVHQTILTYGVGESLLAEILEEWEENLPSDMHLAYLPSPGSVRLRLSVSGKDRKVLQERLNNILALMPVKAKECVRSYEDVEFPEIIIKELQIRKKTISFAESCTGGKLAVLFSTVPGVSSCFRGGIVPYATEVKTSFLGVDSAVVDEFSVVSEEVAIEMAKEAQKKFQSDYAISTTGNAGPTKGDSTVEIGTVCIGIATPTEVYAKTYFLGQPREKVVNSAIARGLELIYNEIIKNKR
ncbi:CinA family nicotinamide mononucleotide deamidase-related protein [Myroides pelagicus]|uniref:CinA-like protein n=1 Tax=Myroides pelagicus TaxID=270914 RepID=A0A7K1GRX2_9FLAO|nr:CinA family nicotinamide mononucleotide deamidase-related protein [Myroides pelagicus]MEC4114634.1 CinA family nicotinamide mononucleotide deamidase-related protein [Myroides pelagicus]MTH30714.1 CinA family nicotinamide mononucleotide deamidase-related protein [Myroides pelagicus]